MFGGASLLLASAAHLAAGGVLPAAGVLAVAGVLVGLTTTAATARRRRFGAVIALLSAQQVAMHVLFDAATTHQVLCHPGAAHHLSAASDLAQCGLVTHQPMSVGLSMAVAHLIALVATAAVLARGESLVWRLVEEVVLAVSARPGQRRPRAARLVPHSATIALAPVWLSARPLRGPPAV